jgi:ribonucleotide reductase alpha subunit
LLQEVVKRDGRKEPLIPSKLNQWGEWASNSLGKYVDWVSVVTQTVSTLPNTCTTKELQQALIKVCLDHNTWSYNRMAGRLYAALIYKDMYGDEIPSVKAVHMKLIKAGLMVELDYSDAEYDKINSFMKHSRDFELAHYQLEQVRKKYALRDKSKGVEYESCQFVYMRMAMALASDEDSDVKLKDVKAYYEMFSKGVINAPTPNYVNLGTPLRGYASCALHTTNDNAKSLAIGDHIAYTMTCMSAGIGAHINTRSMGDPVRNGTILHQGKLPYYRSLVAATKANLQSGRGGASTIYYPIFDPEVDVISRLKNPMSTEDKKIRGADYALQVNKFVVRKAAKNEDMFCFNSFTAPDLYEAFYSEDQELFAELYTKYEKRKTLKKVWFNPRDVIITVLNEGYETGRAYLHFVDEANTHTPFKESIYSSNLCVTPDTLIMTDKGNLPIGELRGQNVTVYNGVNYTNTVVVKTGEDQEIIEVVVGRYVDGRYEQEVSVKATPYHKWYLDAQGEPVRTFQLEEGDWLESWEDEEGRLITSMVACLKVAENSDTYCVSEFERGKAIFNGILTGNCNEIELPTKGYSNMQDLYNPDFEGEGEIALCSLAAINVGKVKSEKDYEDAAYYSLKMIDKVIHLGEYVFPHLEKTAKSRLSAGIGITGLAEYMAQGKLSFSSPEGKRAMHELAERHAYYAIKASLRLAKEKGNAPWISKTKWPEGWLPIDSYNKNVDNVVDSNLVYDWETLRKDIISQGGIRNSVLIAHMPTESSSKASGATNGLYPIRDLNLMKTDNSNVIYWCASDGDKLSKHYELAWDVPSKDIIEMYSIFQKFCDQGISADMYRKILGADKVTSKEMLQDFFYMTKLGMKGRYYQNTATSNGTELIETEIEESGCADGVCKL